MLGTNEGLRLCTFHRLNVPEIDCYFDGFLPTSALLSPSVLFHSFSLIGCLHGGTAAAAVVEDDGADDMS